MATEKTHRGRKKRKDIDYSEPVEYLPGFEVPDQEIKEFLIDKALQEI